MMKENWTYKKLGDVCDIQYGYPFDSACFSTSPDEGMPLIRIRDVKDGHTSTYFKGDYPKEYIIHKGDYLVGMDGEFNIAPWKSEDALLNQRVCKVASKSTDVSMGFLYRFLIKELKKIEDETPFVTVKHLSAKRLNQVYLSIPTLSEQQRIVSELDLLQSIIDKQQTQLKELDKLAQAVFYDMFGDPVENEKGWEVKSLKDVCSSLFAGGDVPKDSFSKEKTTEYPIPIISNGIGEKAIYGYTNRARVVEESITISGRGTIGYCEVRKEPFFPIIRLVVATPQKQLVSALLLKFIIDFHDIQGIGVAIPQLTIPMVKDIPIILPPLSLQQSFAAKIESIEKQKAAISQSIAETQKLFNYTMDKYFG